jgi:hypothetical protein
MNRSYCEKEQEIAMALRTRAWTPGLRNHASHCQICADVMVVAGALQVEAELAGTEYGLQSAGLIWWKAQLLARNAALARATRPIELATKVACVICGVAMVWFGAGAMRGSLRIGDAFNHQVLMGHLLSGEVGKLTLIGGIGTLLCVVLGSWYLAWSER